MKNYPHQIHETVNKPFTSTKIDTGLTEPFLQKKRLFQGRHKGALQARLVFL